MESVVASAAAEASVGQILFGGNNAGVGERQGGHIGGMHLPMGELAQRMAEIPHDTDIVVYCEKGIRSVIALQRLELAGYTRLYNLTGGMRAWKEQ